MIDKIKNVLSEFQDCNLHDEAAREIISIYIYNEVKSELDKKNERGL